MNFQKSSRREFLRRGTFATAAITSGLAFSGFSDVNRYSKQLTTNKKSIPVPNPAQIAWQDCEIGMIFHFDISVVAGRHDERNNSYREVFDPHLYNPVKLNTDQWIEAAKAAGAKYAIFTATHFNGFLQWQSNAYPYGLKQTKWKNGKGDIVGDFVNSCHKAGIKPGIYLSTHRNAYWQLWDYYVDWGQGKGTPQQEKFNRAAEVMVRELCSQYGPLIQIWFDAGTKLPHEGGPDVLPIFEKYQPDSVFYHSSKRSDIRWIGNEDGYAANPCWATMPGEKEGHSRLVSSWSNDCKPLLESGDPKGGIWAPGMVDVPFRGGDGIHNWFWAPEQNHAIYSKDKMVDMYYDSVGRNCNLVIGEVITPEGLVPETDIARLKEFRDELHCRFNRPIARTQGKGNKLHLKFSVPQNVNHIIIQEDIRHGERIREYVVEGMVNGAWKKLCEGESVGHKRIEKFDDVVCSGLRLRIINSIAKPDMLDFSAFHVN